MLGALTLARISMAFGPDGERVVPQSEVSSNGHGAVSGETARALAHH